MPYQIEMICCRLCPRRYRITENERVLENHAISHRSNSNSCFDCRMVWYNRKKGGTKCSRIIKLLRKRGPSFAQDIKEILNMVLLPERRIVSMNKELQRVHSNTKPRFTLFYLNGQEKLAWKRIKERYNPQMRKKTYVLRTLGLNRKEVLVAVEPS